MPEFWRVNADVTINDKDGIGMIGTNHILIMHVAQVNFWGGISPVSRVLEFKSHLSHICCDFFVANWLPVDERLLNNNFEFPSLATSKTQYKETRLGDLIYYSGAKIQPFFQKCICLKKRLCASDNPMASRGWHKASSAGCGIEATAVYLCISVYRRLRSSCPAWLPL